jgi:eukaryotic-like serine/threonine-protein kinase
MPDLPTIEGFRVLEEIGGGTMSSVYSAVDLTLGRRVAIKVLRSTIQPTSPFAALLEREARVLAELGHPNIGLLYAFSKTDTRMYMVLELVDGFSLATLLKKKGTVEPDGVAAIGAAVARGLQHAHEQGIVHRDIKPANILVSRRGEVKIFDFGIAQRTRSTGEPASSPSMQPDDVAAFGTPAYMSPEQILGDSVDARSDIFSVGILLYQLVSGARPFDRRDGTDERTAAHRIRRDPPIPLHRRAPGVPVALERIVMRALEKLPGDRFQTARELAEELEGLAGTGCGLRGDRRTLRAVEQSGLVPPAAEGTAPAKPIQRKRHPLRRAIIGIGVLGAAVIGSAFLLQSSAPHGESNVGAAPLELVPPSPGFMRVLATPWADVWIDGQKVDTTPFARPIPLRPGTHYLALVHPEAPVEKRTVEIVSGETRMFDVVMSVTDVSPRDATGDRQSGAEREKKR